MTRFAMTGNMRAKAAQFDRVRPFEFSAGVVRAGFAALRCMIQMLLGIEIRGAPDFSLLPVGERAERIDAWLGKWLPKAHAALNRYRVEFFATPNFFRFETGPRSHPGCICACDYVGRSIIEWGEATCECRGACEGKNMAVHIPGLGCSFVLRTGQVVSWLVGNGGPSLSRAHIPGECPVEHCPCPECSGVRSSALSASRLAEVLRKWSAHAVGESTLAEQPEKKPRRFDTPGRKWLQTRNNPGDGPPSERLACGGGREHFIDSLTTRTVAAYVHPRSLKGRVNVAQLSVDDPCGDDVGSDE